MALHKQTQPVSIGQLARVTQRAAAARPHASSEMLEGELDEEGDDSGGALEPRVAALEARCRQQAEELLCLRSTLADALRRLSSLESRVDASRPRVRLLATPQGAQSTPSPTPSDASRELRPRQAVHREAKRTVSYGSTTSLPHRRGAQHQSSGSLQSDSPGSSSSLSPAPSPSPRATPAPPTPPAQHAPQPYRSRNNSTSSNQSTAAGGGGGAAAGNSLTRRWNSTGDFGAHGFIANASGSSPGWQFTVDEGMRVWIRGRPLLLPAPADVPAPDPERVAPPPAAKLKLEWVHGYRGKDCRSNLYLLPTGELAYFVAAVVVLFNVEEQSQRHYAAHSAEVRCLAVHPNRLMLASGQAAEAGGRPLVRVWDAVSLSTLAVLSGPQLRRSVACVGFSRGDNGTLLACVDDAPDHALSVWEWRRGHCLAETKCSVDTVVAAEFHPLDRNQLVTCGKNHIAFWTLDQGNVLYKRLGVFERDKPRYVTCITFDNNGDVVSGDSNGTVTVWTRGTNTAARAVRGVHEGAVFALCALREGGLLSGGGKDGRVVTLGADLKAIGEAAVLEGHYGGVRALTEGRTGRFFVGTTRNCILQSAGRGALTPAVLGHADEVTALAAHPTLPQYVTAGRDRLLQLWDGLSHSTVWSKDIEERASCCAWSKDGSVVVVGCDAGRWLIFDPASRDLLSQHQDGCEPMGVAQFSPDGSLLALGSHDGHIYVYQVQDRGRRYSRLGKCSGHSSPITHLDWSADGQLLRSNSTEYEVLHWSASTCRSASATAVREARWATATCPLSFEMAGAWPESGDGPDVTTCAAAAGARLAAAADELGRLRLYSFPVTQPKSLNHVYGAHAAAVPAVRFLPDESRLVSVGGADTAVMQWAVE
ncbi:Echinoderm microtubule-associated protein-like 1 [Eumeta japonica]|uniref:Echinoderm microtubule-associated protein-like 1 n=1 Tax=Eumeta variegata TaxID=151549 RepID=A0A4C1V533_EUMVA|nr:Echinoderm microtubule-associated protein-like 1 [Eumeta japonica]